MLILSATVSLVHTLVLFLFFFFQAEDGIRDTSVTGVQTCALPISSAAATIATGSGRARHKSPMPAPPRTRSEERRVGKECRSRWSPDHYNKKEMDVRNWRSRFCSVRHMIIRYPG